MVLFVFYNDLPEENVQIIIGNFIIGVGSVSIVNSAVIVIVRFYVNLKINLQLDNYLSKAWSLLVINCVKSVVEF